MPRFRWDKDLEEVVEIRPQSNFFEEEKPQGPNVISDTMEGGINGTRAMYRADKKHFDSKSKYRADVRANGLVEVGNERNFESKPPPPDKDRYHKIVKESWDRFDGNHNGTADQVRQAERISTYRRDNAPRR